jgi:TetR/AcrR family transcriptional regulator, fatty acid metabolism regulator protein
VNEVSKRIQILSAAEKIMSLKGLNDASISEIAKEAGVAESVIYQFFKGKEDLLFSVPGERMKEVINYLHEHLEGIRDVESRLRKMIWFTLYFNDTNRDYARLLLLECRSNKNFYHHEAYSLIRKYAGILLSILEEGVKTKVFRSDVNMRLVRDIILGALDLEKLGCLAREETKETVSDFEDIMALVMPMITNQTQFPEQEMDKSSRILRAAEQAFAEKGYHQATITDIAGLANVADGTVYEYFKNKEDLLFSIADYQFKDHVKGLTEVFESRSPLRKLQQLISYHFFLYLTQRDFLKVFLLHIQLNRRFYSSDFFNTYRHYTNVVESILEEGKKDGSIRLDTNDRVFRNLFLGAFSHMVLRWLMFDQETEVERMKEIDELVLLLSRSVAFNLKEIDNKFSVFL